MLNKFIRNSAIIILAAAVILPSFAFADEGNARVGFDFRGKVKSFLHIPDFSIKADAEARHEAKIELKDEDKKEKEEKKSLKTELRTVAKTKVSAFPGAVTTVNGDSSLTVTGDDGKVVKVTFTSDTKVKNRNTTGAIADVTAGSKVIVRGAWNSDKTELAAKEIQIVDSTKNPVREWFLSLFAQHMVNGVISAVNGNTITVTGNADTSYTVDISGAKLIGRNPFTQESVSDLKVGDKVQVLGNVSGTSVSAQVVHDLTVEK